MTTDDSFIDLTKHFVCLHCCLIVNDPHEIECCGSLICKECVPAYKKKNTTCAKCYSLLALVKPNCFAKRMLTQITLNCIFNCGASKSHLEIREHSLICEKRIYMCTDCNFEGSKVEFKQHFIDDHEASFFKAFDLYKESKTQNITDEKSGNRCTGMGIDRLMTNKLKLQSYNQMNYSITDEFDYIPNIESGPVHINKPTKAFNTNRFRFFETNQYLERSNDVYYDNSYSNSDTYHSLN